MHDPARTLAVLGLGRLGTARLGFSPRDSRPEHGVSENGPRYAYAADYSVALYNEEEDVAGELTLEIEKGTTFLHTVRWEQRNGDPVDVTGATARLQVRKTKATDGVLVLSMDSEAAIGDPAPLWYYESITITGAAGKFELRLEAFETAELEAGDWFYDMVVTMPASEVFRIIEGRMTVDAGVTA